MERNYQGENLSVIVAAFNEEDVIADTVRRIRKSVPEAEILVVDDGSSDRTTEAVRSLGIKDVRAIGYETNRGKGYAIRYGIDRATREIQAQVDADSQFLPEELPKLLGPILEGRADITFGTRFRKGSDVREKSLTKSKRLASFVVSSFASIVTGQKFTDIMAGFKAWRTDAIRDLNIKCPHFGYEPEIAVRARRKGYSIQEVPISYDPRYGGQSKVNLFREGVIIPLFVLKTRFGSIEL